MNETISSIIISLVTGIISGLLSGWIVTQYFRKVDNRNEEKKIKSQYLNIFIRYLYEFLIEVELAEKSGDYTELYRLIKKKTDYIADVYEYSVISDSARESFSKVEKKLYYIEQGIEKKNISIAEIKNEIRSILIIMLEIMADCMSGNCKNK